MLEKTFTFTDYEGNERKETHYFHMSKAEIMMWVSTDKEYTVDKKLLQLFRERNGRQLMEFFEDLIHRSYGRKSLDGRRFEKSEAIWMDFYQTEAYSELFMELVTDADKASAFLSAIVPASIADEMKVSAENRDKIPAELRDYLPKS